MLTEGMRKRGLSAFFKLMGRGLVSDAKERLSMSRLLSCLYAVEADIVKHQRPDGTLYT